MEEDKWKKKVEVKENGGWTKKKDIETQLAVFNIKELQIWGQLGVRDFLNAESHTCVTRAWANVIRDF